MTETIHYRADILPTVNEAGFHTVVVEPPITLDGAINGRGLKDRLDSKIAVFGPERMSFRVGERDANRIGSVLKNFFADRGLKATINLDGEPMFAEKAPAQD